MFRQLPDDHPENLWLVLVKKKPMIKIAVATSRGICEARDETIATDDRDLVYGLPTGRRTVVISASVRACRLPKISVLVSPIAITRTSQKWSSTERRVRGNPLFHY